MQICFKCLAPVTKDDCLHGLHQRCFIAWFHLEALTDFDDVVIKQNEDEVSLSFHSSFFQGKFKKYSAQLGNKHYILKVQQKEYPELPHVEYISNQIAATLGLRVFCGT